MIISRSTRRAISSLFALIVLLLLTAGSVSSSAAAKAGGADSSSARTHTYDAATSDYDAPTYAYDSVPSPAQDASRISPADAPSRVAIASRQRLAADLRGFAVAAEAVEPSAQSIIQSTARAQAGRGAEALKASMTNAERAAYEANPAGGSRFVGQAVHRATADALDEAYPGRFLYRTRGPDFVDTTTGEMLELTTPGQVASHMLRPGYGGVTYATYGLPW